MDDRYLRRHNFAAYQRIMLDFRLNERELDTFGVCLLTTLSLLFACVVVHVSIAII
jgi:hypothetical protein